ncbi:ATP-binding protein [Streptomyces sp. NPDC005574]|uniref:ATP-binding protein n=1 Tax=Streptomyces sp. NPDC005574 TaxID=3156891 RepID=UPI0033B5584E
MIIPLMKQAADEQGKGERATLSSSVAWDSGAVRVADARRMLRAFLARAPQAGRASLPTRTSMDAQLAVSELVTNAIRHAPGPCGMVLELSAGELSITVWDTSTDEPVMREHDPRRVGGHGLRLVQSVSHRVAVASRSWGKQITARLLLDPDAATDASDLTIRPLPLQGPTSAHPYRFPAHPADQARAEGHDG